MTEVVPVSAALNAIDEETQAQMTQLDEIEKSYDAWEKDLQSSEEQVDKLLAEISNISASPMSCVQVASEIEIACKNLSQELNSLEARINSASKVSQREEMEVLAKKTLASLEEMNGSLEKIVKDPNYSALLTQTEEISRIMDQTEQIKAKMQ